MNSLINYQEAASNLITIPATRRACLCPRWDTSRLYLRPKGSVLPRRQPDVSRGPQVLSLFVLFPLHLPRNAIISPRLSEIHSHAGNFTFHARCEPERESWFCIERIVQDSNSRFLDHLREWL